MPLVTIKLIEGVYSQEKKEQMIRRMTETMVDLEGEHMRPVTWVVIEEVKSGDWGVGGKAFSCSDVKALADGEVI
ncbi:MAG TPA: 4-oxalocrotonate tautomerase family protein [Syntrophobacteraceae bacterium]|nr:4-oxalocrotonate tautomerase family protein [Syntrophobacteraceae bacterium]